PIQEDKDLGEVTQNFTYVWLDLFTSSQDQVDQQRDELIAKIEHRLVQTTTMASLFTVRWALG
ncbi:MAG: hypothetical protein ACREX4_24345, partial [Gammaproteobacteria bacterium]